MAQRLNAFCQRDLPNFELHVRHFCFHTTYIYSEALWLREHFRCLHTSYRIPEYLTWLEYRVGLFLRYRPIWRNFSKIRGVWSGETKIRLLLSTKWIKSNCSDLIIWSRKFWIASRFERSIKSNPRDRWWRVKMAGGPMHGGSVIPNRVVYHAIQTLQTTLPRNNATTPELYYRRSTVVSGITTKNIPSHPFFAGHISWLLVRSPMLMTLAVDCTGCRFVAPDNSSAHRTGTPSLSGHVAPHIHG